MQTTNGFYFSFLSGSTISEAVDTEEVEVAVGPLSPTAIWTLPETMNSEFEDLACFLFFGEKNYLSQKRECLDEK